MIFETLHGEKNMNEKEVRFDISMIRSILSTLSDSLKQVKLDIQALRKELNSSKKREMMMARLVRAEAVRDTLKAHGGSEAEIRAAELVMKEIELDLRELEQGGGK